MHGDGNGSGLLGEGVTSSVPICISDIVNHELYNKKLKKYEFILGISFDTMLYITEDGNAYVYISYNV